MSRNEEREMERSSDRDSEDRQKAQQIEQLQALIQEYPAEAQLIMAALEDGLTLGPAQRVTATSGSD
jgi:hypothetical protein